MHLINCGNLGHIPGNLAADDDTDAYDYEIKQALRTCPDVYGAFLIHHHERHKDEATKAQAVHCDTQNDGRQRALREARTVCK